MNWLNRDRATILLAYLAVGLLNQCVLLANSLDPVSQAIVSLRHSLEFVGTIPYSANEGVQWPEFKDQRKLGEKPGYEKLRTPGNVSIFLVSRHNKAGDQQQKIDHVELLEKLRAAGVNAQLKGDLAYGVIGGPFFVIEFSYENFHGKIFNVLNPEINNDKVLSVKWYPESLAIAYEK